MVVLPSVLHAVTLLTVPSDFGLHGTFGAVGAGYDAPTTANPIAAGGGGGRGGRRLVSPGFQRRTSCRPQVILRLATDAAIGRRSGNARATGASGKERPTGGKNQRKCNGTVSSPSARNKPSGHRCLRRERAQGKDKGEWREAK